MLRMPPFQKEIHSLHIVVQLQSGEMYRKYSHYRCSMWEKVISECHQRIIRNTVTNSQLVNKQTDFALLFAKMNAVV